MGWFSRPPEHTFDWPDPAEITVDESIREGLTIDPGQLLLDLYNETLDFKVIRGLRKALDEQGIDDLFDVLKSEVNRVRFVNGGYDCRQAQDESAGPLYILEKLTMGEPFALAFWAGEAAELSRAQGDELAQKTRDVCLDYGLPTGVAWVIKAWASVGVETHRISMLDHQLNVTDFGYAHRYQFMLDNRYAQRDLYKCIDKWRR